MLILSVRIFYFSAMRKAISYMLFTSLMVTFVGCYQEQGEVEESTRCPSISRSTSHYRVNHR